MDAINRVFKFQLFNLKKAIGSFLLIILIVNVIGYSATIYYYPRVQFGIYYNNQLASIAGATMIAIIIFLIVYGIIMYHENYRLALSFTATRKDFYKSTIIINIKYNCSPYICHFSITIAAYRQNNYKIYRAYPLVRYANI